MTRELLMARDSSAHLVEPSPPRQRRVLGHSCDGRAGAGKAPSRTRPREPQGAGGVCSRGVEQCSAPLQVERAPREHQALLFCRMRLTKTSGTW